MNMPRLGLGAFRLQGQAAIDPVATGLEPGYRHTDAAQIDALVPKVRADLGPIDIVVNNAGQSRTGPFESITDQIWQDEIQSASWTRHCSSKA